jgi:hypothetical protein
MNLPHASYGALEMAPVGTPFERHRRREWITFIVPMLAIVLVACVAAVMTVACDHDENEQDYDYQTVFDETGIHHNPVDPEDHAPLFPLTASDYYGIVFSICGLVIAAGGGIGGEFDCYALGFVHSLVVLTHNTHSF